MTGISNGPRGPMFGGMVKATITGGQGTRTGGENSMRSIPRVPQETMRNLIRETGATVTRNRWDPAEYRFASGDEFRLANELNTVARLFPETARVKEDAALGAHARRALRALWEAAPTDSFDLASPFERKRLVKQLKDPVSGFDYSPFGRIREIAADEEYTDQLPNAARKALRRLDQLIEQQTKADKFIHVEVLA